MLGDGASLALDVPVSFGPKREGPEWGSLGSGRPHIRQPPHRPKGRAHLDVTGLTSLLPTHRLAWLLLACLSSALAQVPEHEQRWPRDPEGLSWGQSGSWLVETHPWPCWALCCFRAPPRQPRSRRITDFRRPCVSSCCLLSSASPRHQRPSAFLGLVSRKSSVTLTQGPSAVWVVLCRSGASAPWIPCKRCLHRETEAAFPAFMIPVLVGGDTH